MNDSNDVIDPDSQAEVHCRHFIVCKSVWFDPAIPDEFSLGRIVIHLRHPDGLFPARFHRLFVFGQLFGTPGDYLYRIRLVRIDASGYDGEVETQLGIDSQPMEWPGNRPLVVSGEDYVDPFAAPIIGLVIDEPGVYEFQLWFDDFDEPIARERIQARGST